MELHLYAEAPCIEPSDSHSFSLPAFLLFFHFFTSYFLIHSLHFHTYTRSTYIRCNPGAALVEAHRNEGTFSLLVGRINPT